MAWFIRCTFSRIQSYAQAVKAWEKAVIFPRNHEGPRGLVDRRKKHLTIERTSDAEDIILRLYGSPVVTWHKDNSFTLRTCSHPTRSTGMFANHCTPAGMYVSTCSSYLVVTIDGRSYKLDDQLTFRQRDDTWKADKITSPWVKSVVNRERAKQALAEVGYEDFRDWFKVYIQMAAKPAGGGWWGVRSNTKTVELLRDRKWRELVTWRFPNAWSRPDQVLSEIRDAIYKECGCIDHKSVPFLG